MSESGVIPRHAPVDPYVRHLGEVSDINDVRVHVGVDYDAVTIGRYVLTFAAAEEFAKLFVSACWQAGENARHMREETDGMPP